MKEVIITFLVVLIIIAYSNTYLKEGFTGNIRQSIREMRRNFRLTKEELTKKLNHKYKVFKHNYL